MRAVKAAKKRRVLTQEQGLKVPPFLILSITSQCNLHCSGCFAAAAGNINNGNANSMNESQLPNDQWRNIITEASELGVMGFIIAGGEPFLYPGLIDLCKDFKDRFFLILTNGTAITEEDYKRLKRSTNIAILVSLEGDQKQTDLRRGLGVYENAFNTLKQLSKIGVPNGISVTITRTNYKYWMDVNNIDGLIKNGIKLGSFIEYIPTTPLSENSDSPSNPSQPSPSCNLT
jgi:MoaA/NifB/PqqE/SkfB family radical SAM enzyme